MTKSQHLIRVEIVNMVPQGDVVVAFLQGETTQIVPIVIGLMEAQSLVMAIREQQLNRPTIYGLIRHVIEKMNGTVRQLVIHSLREETYHAYLLIETSEQPIMLDCRPSDGMVLAKHFSASIYVTSELMGEAGRGIPPG